jgi:hypothetical protein
MHTQKSQLKAGSETSVLVPSDLHPGPGTLFGCVGRVRPPNTIPSPTIWSKRIQHDAKGSKFMCIFTTQTYSILVVMEYRWWTIAYLSVFVV